MIIKTIHLMNFANAHTLAPIMKMRRSETARACGSCSFSLSRSKKRGKLARKQFRPESSQQVGRKRLDAGRRPGLLCDSGKA